MTEDELQHLIDASFAKASPHMKSIMTRDRRLTAAQMMSDLPCPAVLNIATVTAKGEPRVSAVDGHLLEGKWYFTTAGPSPKIRQLKKRSAISAAYTPRDGYGIFCHGNALLLEGEEKQALREHFIEDYGQDPEDWGVGIAYVRIDAHFMVGFAFPEEEIAKYTAEREERRAARAAQ